MQPRLSSLLVLFALLTTACRSTPRSADQLDTVFERYRVAAFDELEALRFTFHARLGERELQRRWEWDRTTGRVAGQDPADDLSMTVYFRTEEGPGESARELDARFVNDLYWLAFPWRLSVDTGFAAIPKGPAPTPIEGREATLVTIQYDDQGGYTPGDAYDLYLAPDGTVLEWVYRRAGADEPTRTARWGEPVELGSTWVSVDFPGPQPDEFRVWFTDVANRVDGQWVEVPWSPQP